MFSFYFCRSTPIRQSVMGCLALCLCCLAALAPCAATPREPLNSVHSPQDIARLFGPEMRQAAVKLKWHGEKLSDDTIYAIALTGLSWEEAWGREHLFSLAWGDIHKAPSLAKAGGQSYAALVGEVRSLYERRDYKRAVDTAYANFSLDEIGCDVNLKETVGFSLLAMGNTEQAFPIFAAPFEPTRSVDNVAETNRHFREAAFTAADRAGITREAIAFSLSLLLEPGTDAPNVHTEALRYLENAGVDIDRVLLGILQAPERLRGFPSYYYAAADLLTYRANPRLLPFFLGLAKSDDVYLRSRALIGLGIIAYHPRAGDPGDWAGKVVTAPLHEFSVSAGERKLILKELMDGSGSDKYRVRAAAAIAISLTGDEEGIPLLQKLAKDRSYVLAPDQPENHDRSRDRRIMFPVRMAACAGLARFGASADPGGGSLSGRDLDRARRGCQDETNDRRNLRREIASQIVVSPIDVATAAPIDSAPR